ncbi:MAG TPA: VTT domain-containing protein [Burkholderiales bacterium]|nr:VTT domain-containing protein [Burkholderiales bacterium]
MDELTALLAQHGLTLVFVNVLLTQLGVPIPSLPILVVAGALIGEGTLHTLPLTLVVVIASLLGDVPWYLAGKRYGYRVLRTLCRISMEPDSCVKQTENIFARWGPSSLVVAKYIPGFSTIAPPLAGAMRVSFGRFVVYSAVAALLWAAAPVIAGYFFREQVEWLLGWIEAMGTGALAVVGVIVLVYIAVKAVQRFLLIRFLRMIRIDVHELNEMMRDGSEPVILDARSPVAREFEPRRIPGAIPVELDSVEQLLDSIPAGRDVVVYCS